MPPSLAEIVDNKRLEVAALKAALPEWASQTAPNGDGRFLRSLQPEKINLICELKPRSPSLGHLKEASNLAETVAAYRKHADCLSVLTDNKYFGGSMALLKEMSRSLALPLLCKDFIVDRLQCLQARHHGADAVLLIVKILNDEELSVLHESITDLGMNAVVEIQNERELERALAVNPQILLINNRDLSTFEIDFATSERLAPRIPSGPVVISASGISSRAEIQRLLPYAHNFLIGSALMLSDNLEQLLQELKAAPSEDGRTALPRMVADA
ncbi:MAG TPA: indole-3-glycerol phosphate synthase TrpC [Chroococcales cyanobacterium]